MDTTLNYIRTKYICIAAPLLRIGKKILHPFNYTTTGLTDMVFFCISPFLVVYSVDRSNIKFCTVCKA